MAAAVKEATGGKGIQVWYETQPPDDLDRTVSLMASRGRIVVMAGRKARPASVSCGRREPSRLNNITPSCVSIAEMP